MSWLRPRSLSPVLSNVPDYKRSVCRQVMTSLTMSLMTSQELQVASEDAIRKRQSAFTEWTNQIQPPLTCFHCLLFPSHAHSILSPAHPPASHSNHCGHRVSLAPCWLWCTAAVGHCGLRSDHSGGNNVTTGPPLSQSDGG